MRSTIIYKFILIYITIVLLGFFFVAVFITKLDTQKALNHQAQSMYNEAVSIANGYATQYYRYESTLNNLKTELKTLSSYNDISILLINTNGDLLLSTRDSLSETESLESFDPLKYEPNQYVLTTFDGRLEQPYATVMAPINYNFATRGYIVIMRPVDAIQGSVTTFVNTNYITLAICMLLAALFPFLIYFEIHRPLKEITLAVKEFGHGNLTYQLKEYDNDEIGRLAASLSYMSAQLNELEESQKKFIANVSHDFRSPLTSIKGYLEAILDGTIPPEMQEKYLNIVISETERLSKLTNNLLTLNNIDSKKNRLNIAPFDINLVIKKTIESFEGQCISKDIKFDLTFSAKSMLVNADVDKITQVLYNLVDNAIKFSRNSSIIYITVNHRGEKVFVSVKDTGIGIPKDAINKIWDRFYKTDLSRGKDKKGTGLGLSIVKEIINAHQENIDVISTEDVGTEFTFSLTKYVEN